MEVRVSQKFKVVNKVAFIKKICYTCPMKTPDQEQPTEMPEACATTPMARAVRLIGAPRILLTLINPLPSPHPFTHLRPSLRPPHPHTPPPTPPHPDARPPLSP